MRAWACVCSSSSSPSSSFLWFQFYGAMHGMSCDNLNSVALWFRSHTQNTQHSLTEWNGCYFKYEREKCSPNSDDAHNTHTHAHQIRARATQKEKEKISHLFKWVVKLLRIFVVSFVAMQFRKIHRVNCKWGRDRQRLLFRWERIFIWLWQRNVTAHGRWIIISLFNCAPEYASPRTQRAPIDRWYQLIFSIHIFSFSVYTLVCGWDAVCTQTSIQRYNGKTLSGPSKTLFQK